MKSIYRLALLPLLIVGMTTMQGCRKDKGQTPEEKREVESTVLFTLTNSTLKSVSTTVEASEAERSIESAMAVVFDNDRLVTAVEATKQGESYAFKLKEEGIYDLYIVANADAEIKKSLENSSISQREFKAIPLKAPSDGKTSLLMTSKPISIYAEGDKSIDAGEIRLHRVVAKINLYNRVHGLVVAKMTYTNVVTTTILDASSATAEMLQFTPMELELEGAATSTAPVGTFYTYPSPKAVGANIEIDGTLNGEPLAQPIVVDIKRELYGDKVYSVVLSSERVIGEKLDPNNLYRDLIKVGIFTQEWSKSTELLLPDDAEVTFHKPTFEVQGEGIEVTEGDPTKVSIPGTKETTFRVITCTPYGTAELSLPTEAEEKIQVTAITNSSKEGNILEQIFELVVAPNTKEEVQEYTISVRNIYDVTLATSLLISQAALEPQPEPNPEPVPVGGATPISFFAKYNINMEGTGFATSNANGVAGYFTYQQIIGQEPLASGLAFKCPEGYRVPNFYDFTGVLPYVGDISNAIGSDLGRNQLKVPRYGDAGLAPILNVTEAIAVEGKALQYSNDYAFMDYDFRSPNTIYGLRLKKLTGELSTLHSKVQAATDNKRMTAYKYEYHSRNPYGTIEGTTLNGILVVTCRFIGESMPNITIDEVAKPEFWSDPNASYEILEFPMDGYNYNPSTGKSTSIGTTGRYMGIGTGSPTAQSTFGLHLSPLQLKTDGLSGYYMNKPQSLRLVKQ